jgi:hypothetical protein
VEFWPGIFSNGTDSIVNNFFTTGRNWEHVLAFVLLLARVGDVWSTYLVTPTLRMEGNPIVRKLGWPFALLTVLVCLVSYYNTALAMILIVTSLFATASNLSRGWIVRALGETEYVRVLQRAAASSRLRGAIGFVLGSSGTYALAGLVLLAISGGPTKWPFWFAMGVISYASAMAIFGCAFMRRLYRQPLPTDSISGVSSE